CPSTVAAGSDSSAVNTPISSVNTPSASRAGVGLASEDSAARHSGGRRDAPSGDERCGTARLPGVLMVLLVPLRGTAPARTVGSRFAAVYDPPAPAQPLLTAARRSIPCGRGGEGSVRFAPCPMLRRPCPPPTPPAASRRPRRP